MVFYNDTNQSQCLSISVTSLLSFPLTEKCDNFLNNFDIAMKNNHTFLNHSWYKCQNSPSCIFYTKKKLDNYGIIENTNENQFYLKVKFFTVYYITIKIFLIDLSV